MIVMDSEKQNSWINFILKEKNVNKLQRNKRTRKLGEYSTSSIRDASSQLLRTKNTKGRVNEICVW